MLCICFMASNKTVTSVRISPAIQNAVLPFADSAGIDDGRDCLTVLLRVVGVQHPTQMQAAAPPRIQQNPFHLAETNYLLPSMMICPAALKYARSKSFARPSGAIQNAALNRQFEIDQRSAIVGCVIQIFIGFPNS